MINNAQIEYMIKQINGAPDLEKLMAIKNAHLNMINSAITEITTQQAKITELYAPLMSVPTDLDGVINWIQSMVTNIAIVQVENGIKYAIDLANLNSAINTIESAVEQTIANF